MSDPTQRLQAAIAGRYTIERQLGLGGMATVYLANDLKHDRKVALKVLRPELAAVLGAERFLHEIRVTANLHHPNILPLHDSGEADSLLFYVMPYIDGESLRQKLNREKHLDVREAIEIARAVAGALDYAHRRGVIHRDIKPENILLHDGHASVADFGIALAVRTVGGERLTEAGLSLGTPHYMSPEQAMGDRQIDGRSDVYSLGAVLYEMLAGDPPHDGSTAQAIVAKVITQTPTPLRALRDTIPPHVAWATHKALAKLPVDRFATAASLAEGLASRSAMDLAGAVPDESIPVPGARRRSTIAIAVVALVAIILAGWAFLAPGPRSLLPLVRFALSYPEDAFISDVHGSPVALSPDGSVVVYAGQNQLYLRRLEQIEPVPIPNTAGGSQPFFSPGGDAIAFHAQGKIKRVALNGGPALTLCDAPGVLRGGTWGAGGDIVFSLDTALFRVSATGGTPGRVAWPNPEKSEAALRWPSFLPDGRRVLLTLWKGSNEDARIGVFDLASGQIRPLTSAGTFPRFVEPGSLAYATGGGTIYSVPFDPRSASVTGAAVPVLENVRVGAAGAAKLGLSRSGQAVHLQGSAVNNQLVLVDRKGAARIIPGEGRAFAHPRVSPDGRTAVVEVFTSARTGEIWLVDLDQGTQARLAGEGVSEVPEWSPDGRRVFFTSNRSGPSALYSALAQGGGAVEALPVKGRSPQEAVPSPDGRTLLYRVGLEPNSDLYYTSADAEPRPFATTQFYERAPAFSPNGKWVAYVSDESGRDEVYVRAFPPAPGQWQVSAARGSEPRWSPDGRELFYRNFDTVFAVSVNTAPTFSVGRRTMLFRGLYQPSTGHASYDVHPNGKEFLFITIGAGTENLVFVQNLAWGGR